MTTVETISDPRRFAELAPQWDALVRAMPRPSPFLLHGWLSAWWAHLGGGRELQVHVACRDGRLQGALPLYVQRRRGLRVAHFLGDAAAALSDLLLAADAEPGTDSRLVAQARAGGADIADLFGLPQSSRLAAAAGNALRLVPRAEAPVLDIDGDWEALYRERTSSKRRNLHRRRRRQLGELGALEVSVARTLPELQEALEAAFVLHAARWEDRPEASGFATPVGRDFHRAALAALAPLGIPQIVLLRLDGRPIACNYHFLFSERMYFHELAFDPEYARFSPGMITTLDAIAAAAEAGARRVEFLGGGERYKLELADRCEPLHQAIGLAGTKRGEAAALALAAGVVARGRLKHTPVRRIYYEGMAPARRVARTLRPARLASVTRSARRGTSSDGASPIRTR